MSFGRFLNNFVVSYNLYAKHHIWYHDIVEIGLAFECIKIQGVKSNLSKDYLLDRW